ncbi:MAG: IS630 family transposase [Firmicutes bacterium]|nr:IS630 family transposase [Bacillota bacterium]
MQEIVRRSPRLYGLDRSRWWLAGVHQQVEWLRGYSLGGIYQICRRLGIRYKRGRVYVHSPDPQYDQKMAAVAAIRALVAAQPGRFVLLYEDECTYYRRPMVAQGYGVVGSDLPHARQGLRPNWRRRVAASLDFSSGRLLSWQCSRFDRATLIRYYRWIEACYPDAERIYVVQDNWPVHFHEEVLAALTNSKVVVVALPTYAPWTNPVEKVWRKLYQEVLHLHDFRDDWEGLQEAVQRWLDRFGAGSAELLRYVGLCPD